MSMIIAGIIVCVGLHRIANAIDQLTKVLKEAEYD